MYNCVAQPRSDVKPHAPRMVKLIIDREFIGAVIGPGGKIIQEIQRETGTTINLEEINNQGEVSIFGTVKEGVDKAVAWVKGIVAVPVEGDEYEAVVKSIMPYGAFVEFLPGKQGLLHISEVSWKRLDTLEGVLNEGDKVKVKLTGTDPKTGKFKLSRKILLPKPEGMSQEQGRRDGGHRQDGRRDERRDGDRPKIERNQNAGQQKGHGSESNEQ
jgi:polyribonucleotide nucleotidyltransferase